MADTKIGLNQVDKPAPLWYRRLSNALIIFVIPATIAMLQGWGLPDKVLNHWMLILAFIPAVIKAVGMILGNGQIYSPSNQVVDAQSSKN
jgi:uncharacterized membrane protein YqaE (UPF0057 family)